MSQYLTFQEKTDPLNIEQEFLVNDSVATLATLTDHDGNEIEVYVSGSEESPRKTRKKGEEEVEKSPTGGEVNKEQGKEGGDLEEVPVSQTDQGNASVEDDCEEEALSSVSNYRVIHEHSDVRFQLNNNQFPLKLLSTSHIPRIITHTHKHKYI